MGSTSLKNRLLSGGFWALSGRILSVLAALAVNALLSRMLPPNEMGSYFLILSAVSILSIVAQLGMNLSIVRIISESITMGKQRRAYDAIRLVLQAVGVGATLIGLLIFSGLGGWAAMVVFHSPVIGGVVGLVSLYLLVISYQSLFAEIFRGFHDIRLSMLFGGFLSNFISAIVFAVFFIIHGHINIFDVLIVSILATTVSSLIAGVVLNCRIKPLHGEGKLTINELFAISWPNWISHVMVAVVIQADIWILGIFQSTEDVALYGAAGKTAQMTMLVTGLIYAFLPPIIAELYTKNKIAVLEKVLRGSAMANLFVISPIFIVFMIFPDSILAFVYGDYYAKGGDVLFFLSIGLIVNVLTGIRGSVLIMAGYERDMMKLSLFSGSLNIVLCIIAAKYWGMIGVAVAAMVSMSVQSMLELLMVRVRIGIWTHISLKAFIVQFCELFMAKKLK